MLTSQGCAQRRKRLWDALPDDCETLILGDPASLIGLANYAVSPFVFRSCDATAVLILRRDKAILVTDSMVRAYAEQAFVDEVVAPTWYDGKHAAPHRRLKLVQTALETLAKLPGMRLGIEAGSVPAGIVAKDALVFAIDDTVRKLRRAKDADELTLIRASIAAGEAGHAAALAGIHPGMTELDAFLLVQKACNEAAGHQVMIYGDFASGLRVETEHGGPPTLRKIEAGDLFLLDYSVVVHGYRGDFTNTFVVGGKPTDGQKRLFHACIEAMEAGEKVLKAGVAAAAVDRAVRGSIDSNGLLDAYPSHTGHGLGLSHPEPPYFVPESDETVVAGDVVAIEPGLFVKGVGGMRFERNYLVTSEGFENLTHHKLTLEQG